MYQESLQSVCNGSYLKVLFANFIIAQYLSYCKYCDIAVTICIYIFVSLHVQIPGYACV